MLAHLFRVRLRDKDKNEGPTVLTKPLVFCPLRSVARQRRPRPARTSTPRRVTRTATASKSWDSFPRSARWREQYMIPVRLDDYVISVWTPARGGPRPGCREFDCPHTPSKVVRVSRTATPVLSRQDLGRRRRRRPSQARRTFELQVPSWVPRWRAASQLVFGSGRPSGDGPGLLGGRAFGAQPLPPRLNAHTPARPRRRRRSSAPEPQLELSERWRSSYRGRPWSEPETSEQVASLIGSPGRLEPAHRPRAAGASIEVGFEDVPQQPSPALSARRLVVLLSVEPELELIAAAGGGASSDRAWTLARPVGVETSGSTVRRSTCTSESAAGALPRPSAPSGRRARARRRACRLSRRA